MANYGALHPQWAPFEGEEPTSAKPTYGTVMDCGKLVNVSITPAYAAGQDYGDDQITEDVSEFINAATAIESTDLPLATSAAMYGHTYAEADGLKKNAADVAPYGGFGFVRKKILKGVLKYEGFFLPKVKMVEGADTAATKNSSITFGHPTINGSAYQPNVGDWEIVKEFDTLAAADAFVTGCFTAAGA